MTDKQDYFAEIAEKCNTSIETVYTVYYGEESIHDEILHRKILSEFIIGTDVMYIALVWKGYPFPGAMSNIDEYNFVGQVVEGVNLQLYKTDYVAQVFPCNSSIADEAYFKRLMSKRKGAGILVLVGDKIDVIQSVCKELNSHFILLTSPAELDLEDYYVISIDNKRIVANSVSYLYELGHRRIAHITGLLKHGSANERLAGYYQGMQEMGLDVEPEWVEEGNWRETRGYSATKNLLALKNPPTAIITANDRMAVGTVQAIHEAGLKIPDDISVVGFDDTANSVQVQPTITTVRVPMTRMGQVAARTMISLLEGGEVNPRHQYLLTEFIIRESTGIACDT